jgi:integrase
MHQVSPFSFDNLERSNALEAYMSPRHSLAPGEIGHIRHKQLGRGKWAAECYLGTPTGAPRRMYRSGRTKQEAERTLLEAVDVARVKQGGSLDDSVRVELLVHKWRDSKIAAGDWRPSSVRSMSAAVEQLGEAMQWRVGAVTYQMVEDRLAQIAVQRPGQYGGAHVKGGASTANVCRRILHEALQIAVRERAIPINPVDREGRKFKPVKRKARRTVTAAELIRLRAVLLAWERGGRSGNRQMPLVDGMDLLAGTGLRVGELCALRWENLDLDSATLAVSATMASAGTSYRQEGGKGAGSARDLELPAVTVTLLKRRHLAAGRPSSGPVLASRAGTHIQVGNFERSWRAARAGTEFEDVTPHTIRRTVADAVKAATGSDEQAQHQLGHTSAATTRRFYLTRGTSAGNGAALDGFLSSVYRPAEFEAGDATGAGA